MTISHFLSTESSSCNLQQVPYPGLCVMDLISKLGRVNLKLCLGIAGVQLIGYALYKVIKTAFFSKLLKVSFKMSTKLTMFGHFQYFFPKSKPCLL